MQRRWIVLLVVLLGTRASAQGPVTLPPDPAAATRVAAGPINAAGCLFDNGNCSASEKDPLAGNSRLFPNFIGFLSNPLQNIDPRALTQIWPMFGSVWTSG